MVSEAAKKAALEQMRTKGVVLTVEEPAGVNRCAEPVTSGVPLPEGLVRDASSLCLLDGEGKPVPCQFTVLTRWPAYAASTPLRVPAGKSIRSDSDAASIKWVLLDFQANVAPSNKVAYTLRMGGGNPLPEKPVKVSSASDIPVPDRREAGGRGRGPLVAGSSRDERPLQERPRPQGFTMDSGPIRVGIATNLPGLIHSVVVDGKEVLSVTNPVQVVLVNEDGKIYRGPKPTRVAVEHSGPMRGTLLVQGQFVGDDGDRIYDGKVGYDLRISAYAGKPYLKLDFTLKNDGWYGYHNEGRNHPRQWLFFKSLRLDIPLRAEGNPVTEAVVGDMAFPLAGNDTVSLVQWYKYPYQNERGLLDINYTNAPAAEVVSGLRTKLKGFHYAWTTNTVLNGRMGRIEGSARLMGGKRHLISLGVRRFWQNFPEGFSVTAARDKQSARLSFLMFPEGGFWPRTRKAFDTGTYQFEGGRRKTATMLVGLGDTIPEADQPARNADAPLFARAPTKWYRDTGAVIPLAGSGVKCNDGELTEAMERYDRLQRAKVGQECGDTAGRSFGESWDRWGKVSIPSLWERSPDIFAGWMNFGDLVWPFGYCSLFYEWPYSMLQQYLRLGDREFLDVAEDMIRHRYDIDQYHVENTEPYLAGFQRNERGEHGHLERQERTKGRNTSWESNCRPSHTWDRCLLLHWALTGDPRSLDAAMENGRAFRRFFYDQNKLGEKEKFPFNEFRTPVWAMENWLALYEYTGEKTFLDWSNEVFDKTVFAMEKDNGSCGHILKDGKQGAQFVSYMVEPVCRLYHHTRREEVIQFLKRVLDWQRKEGTLRGMEEDGSYYPLLWREDWDFEPTLEEDVKIGAGKSYDFPLVDGYAYLYQVLGREEDLTFARRLFKDVMFYLTIGRIADSKQRSPLGYHHLGNPLSSAAKIHAWSGRYCQLYLYVEETH